MSNNYQSNTESSTLISSNTKQFQTKRVLGVTSVTFLVYFNVCGGPWGSEEMFSDAGPLPGLIGIFIFALCWGLPVASMTSELSSAFPDDGGYSIWVGEAFGSFWGFQESYYSWISGVVDNAIYPGIVYSVIINVLASAQIDHTDAGIDTITMFMQNHPGYKYLAKLSIATLFMLPNLFYVRGVGTSAGGLAAFVMAPFVVLIALSFPYLEPNRLFLPPWNPVNNNVSNTSITFITFIANNTTPSSSSNSTGYYGYPQSWSAGWGDLFSVLYWNLSGFDCISTAAGEVKDVGYTISRSLSIALVLIVLTYVLPLSFATMATDPKLLPNWGNDDGECSWSCIARSIGGEWIMYWILLASIAGNMGMYVAEMFEDSWQLFGMAENGMMPAVLGQRHPKYGTPFNAVLVSYVLIAGLCYFDFMDNLSINNFFSCGSCLLEILAFLKLRWSKPDLIRPFTIPLNFTGVALLSLLPMLLGGFVLISSCTQSYSAVILNTAALLFGIVLYVSMKKYGGFKYNYNAKRKRMMSKGEEEKVDGRKENEKNDGSYGAL